MTRLTVLLITCALISPLTVYAAPPLTLAQLEAQQCATLGKLAATVTAQLESGLTYQVILDILDTILAEGPRDHRAIERNTLFRRVAQQVALTPSWSPTQARVSIEMACLRGDYP